MLFGLLEDIPENSRNDFGGRISGQKSKCQLFLIKQKYIYLFGGQQNYLQFLEEILKLAIFTTLFEDT